MPAARSFSIQAQTSWIGWLRNARRGSIPSIIICTTSGLSCAPRMFQCAATMSSTVCPYGRCSALARTGNHRLLAPSTISRSRFPQG